MDTFGKSSIAEGQTDCTEQSWETEMLGASTIAEERKDQSLDPSHCSGSSEHGSGFWLSGEEVPGHRQ